MQIKGNIYLGILLGLLFVGCNPSASTTTDPKAQAVVDSAIARSNLHLLANAEASFDFRDRSYGYKMKENQFEYTRLYIDSTGTETYDVLTNSGFTRYINGEVQELVAERQNAYANSVNSVIYFAFLPYRLNDASVIKNYLDKVKVLDKEYHKIQVTFRQEGGGEDFEDVFIYWFDSEDYSMDYFAYEYQTNGGGIRFREATNPRNINSIQIQDYINYKPKPGVEFKLSEIDRYYQQGKLEKLSDIDLKNLNVKLNNN
ncbi:DUF6503 family protein [Ekhidna sp.]|jgi:hypothetical protein|uniref:DUF6503 family protein n=1 Tax=Ekhidna sp. TaxID=2608089 RepID=UPI003B5B8EC6